MKFKFKFNLLYYCLLAICASAFTASLVLSAVNLSKSYEFYSPALDLINLIISVLILILLISLLLVRYYKFDETALRLRLSLYRFSIPYSRIVLVREDVLSKDMALYYKKTEDEKDETISLLMINIKKDQNAAFFNELKKRNGAIVYELFEKNKMNGENTDEL